MDSKVVNKEIKRLIWPMLKAVGFDTFTSRAAWRHSDEKIDVVEFQSFNNYNANVIGITTFSFAVRLGTQPLYVPPQWPPKIKNGLQLPTESECYFRKSMLCSLQSKIELKDETIWSVDIEGKNLSWCIQDVVNQIPAALAWFLLLSNKNEVMRILLEDDEDMLNTWGFGRNPSPIRSYLTGYLALSVGNMQLAETKLQEAIESKCFTYLFATVDGAINRAV